MISQTFEFLTSEIADGVVFGCKGYFNDKAGEALEALIMSRISQGKKAFVVDFTECSVVNSVGIAFLMTLAFKLTDDVQAKIGFSGLDAFKINVFSVAGLIPLVTVGKTPENCLELLDENN